MRRQHANLLLVFAAAIWGFAFLFQKSAMNHMGPVFFVAARSIVACLALLPLAIHEMRASRAAWRDPAVAALPAGAVFLVGAVLQQWGLVTATVTNTGFLTALYVVFVPFIAWYLLRRRPGKLVWMGVILSFAGTWALGGGSLAGFSPGDGLVALSAVFWALHIVLVGRASALGCPMTFTMLQFVVVAVLALALAPGVESISLDAIRAAWIEIAYIGLLSTALTFTLFSLAMRHTGPGEATIIVSTETLFAAFGAWLFLGERLPPIGWLGAGLILLATLLIQFAPKPAPSTTPPESARSPSIH